jgi:hypothetical protein
VIDALDGTAGVAAIPAAAIAARAWPELPLGASLCFAEPLHVIAGISRVHLPPGGRLQLPLAESAAWVEAFNREFGDAQLQLRAVAGGWLLAAPFAHAARDAAPETLLGQPLARVAARDEHERALRRLGAEAEMWLAAHALNRAREARQQPPINSLWLCGGARAEVLPRFARAPRAVFIDGQADPWLAGLAAHCMASLGGAVDWLQVSTSGDALLVLPAPAQGASAQHWQRLEAQWLEPAARALRDGSVGSLRLQLAGSAWQLPDPSPLRWLRRQRPWHERLRA